MQNTIKALLREPIEVRSKVISVPHAEIAGTKLHIEILTGSDLPFTNELVLIRMAVEETDLVSRMSGSAMMELVGQIGSLISRFYPPHPKRIDQHTIFVKRKDL
jgi:hypothetical protein